MKLGLVFIFILLSLLFIGGLFGLSTERVQLNMGRSCSLFTIDIKNKMTLYLDTLRLVKSSPLPIHRNKEKIPHG